MEQTHYYGTGKRKASVARVWLRPGQGGIVVNTLDIKEYLPRKTLQAIVIQPFEATSTLGRYDVKATVMGGGQTGQAGALRHGIGMVQQPAPLGGALAGRCHVAARDDRQQSGSRLPPLARAGGVKAFSKGEVALGKRCF